MTPYFDSLAAFLAMGKHGVYVWTCWGLVVLATFFGIWQSRQQRRQVINQISARQVQKNKTTTGGK